MPHGAGWSLSLSEVSFVVDTRTRTFVGAPGKSRESSGPAGFPPEILAGRFRLLEVLGAGGSGTVWSAEDLVLNERVAIKILHHEDLDEKELARLKREVRTARASHPNMVRIFDLHEAEGLHFLSMELVEGESLGDLLRREEKLPVESVIRIGAEIAAALEYLHERGIIHRDVKPGNILLTADGTAKLCDMGLARPMQAGMTLTATEMVVGTPAYMAPEQATGHELQPASDIYALGLTLYRCLSGEVPHGGTSPLSTLMRRQKERPPRIRAKAPDTPRWLSRLIRRMLEPEPRERPGASAIKSALARARYRYRPRRRTVLMAAAVVMVACIAALGYSYLRRGATQRVEVGKMEVHGLDLQGRQTWRRELDLPIGPSLKTDLDGDGIDEIVVATKRSGGEQGSPGPPTQIHALKLNGDLLFSVRPREIIGSWQYPFPINLDLGLRAADLDLDGRSELVVVARQEHFFPTVLLLYQPASGSWCSLMENPGYIRQVELLPDRHNPRIRFAGVRNRPLMAPIVGEIALDAVSGFEPKDSTIRIKDGKTAIAGARLNWYTMLDPSLRYLSGDIPALKTEPDQGLLLVSDQASTIRLDRWGNVLGTSGPAADLHRQRLEFLAVIKDFDNLLKAADPESLRHHCKELRSKWKDLLQEPAYAIALNLVQARALARAKDLKGAIGILDKAAAAISNEDLDYRLAQLLAIEGRAADAISHLQAMVSLPESRRGAFDAPILLIRIAIEERNSDLIEKSLRSFRTEEGVQVESAIKARVRLWWDQSNLSDCVLAPVSYEPAAGALACLARWRLGKTVPDDPEKMRGEGGDHPDARWEYRLAEAAADLGLGRASEALGLLDSCLPGLQADAVDDFSVFQLLQLGRALHARAQLDAGDPAAAQSEARELLKTLTPERLPAIIAREVLEQCGERP